jgi:ribonuclease HI
MDIYTDGGCSGNPGPGGWAFVIVLTTFQGTRVVAERSGGEKDTTNNRMELAAVIAALEFLGTMQSVPRNITLYTDSQYVQKGMNEWLAQWKSKGWRTSAKESVKNRDLWERLDALNGQYSITWEWVKGHSGNPYNEHCDTLTQRAIAQITSSR